MSESIGNIMNTAIGALIMAYGIFCMVKGGIHVKNVGWRTKEEYPKSYYFGVTLMILLGVSIISYSFILKR